ncbi:hypothetical protein BOTBODRAFT_34593 [Botryobasidium botryosum FD-172 SS1]|uniref:Cytochrome b mRNA-processing protein 4 n=1 Tax=Botryobasidium botryosum (strain FD-172 SS1) TaxID=930990 RepID=A0A067ML92_BOTB1|nr:hypothetical protein BOTBODRAFT_34593 [Botryobasidium botryosum FD-172 SS1]
MNQVPWGKFALMSAGIVGVGYATMKATVPNEQQMYDALAPDHKRRVDAIRAQAQQAEARKRVMASDPDVDKPRWADAPNPTSNTK